MNTNQSIMSTFVWVKEAMIMIVESVGLGVKQTWAPLHLVTDCVTALSRKFVKWG